MDYVTSTAMSWLSTVLLVFAPQFAIYIAVFFGRRKIGVKGFVGVGIAMVAAGAITTSIAVIDAKESRATAEAQTLKNFQEHYGITLDSNDLYALGYPGVSSFLSSPEEFTYYNTAPIQTGVGHEDFEQLTLAGEHGKMYLYRQVGATYEELELAEAK